MDRKDNYRIQLQQAQQWFLHYDQEQLIRKLGLQADENYLYTRLFAQPYRLCRRTGECSRQVGDTWVDANTHGEVMTLLDLVCDSREDRFLSHRWKDMLSFGQLFHRNLQETDPWALRFDQNPEGLRRGCLALGGEVFPKGDVAYTIEVFDGLCLVVQLWQSEEDFPPKLRLLWDENAWMYLKYETMHFAKGVLLKHLEAYL